MLIEPTSLKRGEGLVAGPGSTGNVGGGRWRWRGRGRMSSGVEEGEGVTENEP